MYRYLPELDGCIVASPVDDVKTRIHACYDPTISRNSKKRKQTGCGQSIASALLPCGAIVVDERRLLTIRLSAMAWNGWQEDGELHIEVAPRMFRLCYSTHSSWKELREMLRLLRPQIVEANVEPTETLARDRLRQELRTILDEWKEGLDDGGVVGCSAVDNDDNGIDLSGLQYRAIEEFNISAEDNDEENVTRRISPLPKRRKGHA